MNLSDFDRPLNSRGIKAARFMGEFMLERGLIPDIVLCSGSQRTRMTLELLIDSSGFKPEIVYDDRIYEASVGDLLDVLYDHDAEAVLVICHNPGIETLIRNLTGKIEPMPTAALAVLEQIDDAEFQFSLQNVYRPRELMD
jgi:phosphohistidine phosphatase